MIPYIRGVTGKSVVRKRCMKEIDATSSTFSSKWLVNQGIVEAYESSGRLLLIRGIHSSPEEESPVSHLRAICARCRDEVESHWTGERPAGLGLEALFSDDSLQEQAPEQWYASLALHSGEVPYTLSPLSPSLSSRYSLSLSSLSHCFLGSPMSPRGSDASCWSPPLPSWGSPSRSCSLALCGPK